jgi:hypothetical protein
MSCQSIQEEGSKATQVLVQSLHLAIKHVSYIFLFTIMWKTRTYDAKYARFSRRYLVDMAI